MTSHLAPLLLVLSASLWTQGQANAFAPRGRHFRLCRSASTGLTSNRLHLLYSIQSTGKDSRRPNQATQQQRLEGGPGAFQRLDMWLHWAFQCAYQLQEGTSFRGFMQIRMGWKALTQLKQPTGQDTEATLGRSLEASVV